MHGGYYSAEETMKKLKKTRAEFMKELENGLIPFELGSGNRKIKRFPREAIDVIASRQKVKVIRGNPSQLVFSPSSLADMWTEIQIGIGLYGEDDVVPYEKILEWRDINDQMHRSVKEQGQVVAYSCLMPLEESIMLPLIQDKIRERDIPNETIRQWTEPQLSVYVSSLTVKPTENINRDRELGRFIIKHTIRWALSLSRQYDIKNWYGIGATPEGQGLFESLGFTEIVSVHEGKRKGYLLKDIRNTARIINMFLKERDRQDNLLHT